MTTEERLERLRRALLELERAVDRRLSGEKHEATAARRVGLLDGILRRLGLRR